MGDIEATRLVDIMRQVQHDALHPGWQFRARNRSALCRPNTQKKAEPWYTEACNFYLAIPQGDVVVISR